MGNEPESTCEQKYKMSQAFNMLKKKNSDHYAQLERDALNKLYHCIKHVEKRKIPEVYRRKGTVEE